MQKNWVLLFLLSSVASVCASNSIYYCNFYPAADATTSYTYFQPYIVGENRNNIVGYIGGFQFCAVGFSLNLRCCCFACVYLNFVFVCQFVSLWQLHMDQHAA